MLRAFAASRGLRARESDVPIVVMISALGEFKPRSMARIPRIPLRKPKLATWQLGSSRKTQRRTARNCRKNLCWQPAGNRLPTALSFAFVLQFRLLINFATVLQIGKTVASYVFFLASSVILPPSGLNHRLLRDAQHSSEFRSRRRDRYGHKCINLRQFFTR